MEIIMLIIGLLLGGCTVAAFLCCLQFQRLSRYEMEIRKLKEKLHNQP